MHNDPRLICVPALRQAPPHAPPSQPGPAPCSAFSARPRPALRLLSQAPPCHLPATEGAGPRTPGRLEPRLLPALRSEWKRRWMRMGRRGCPTGASEVGETLSGRQAGYPCAAPEAKEKERATSGGAGRCCAQNGAREGGPLSPVLKLGGVGSKTQARGRAHGAPTSRAPERGAERRLWSLVTQGSLCSTAREGRLGGLVPAGQKRGPRETARLGESPPRQSRRPRDPRS